MDDAECVAVLLEALEAGMNDDWRRAFSLLADVMGDDPGAGYGAAAAMAELVLSTTRQSGDGPTQAYVLNLGPGDAPPDGLVDAAGFVAAFIAAYGNGDDDGRMALYRQLLNSEDPQLARQFFQSLFEITVATLKPGAEVVTGAP